MIDIYDPVLWMVVFTFLVAFFTCFNVITTWRTGKRDEKSHALDAQMHFIDAELHEQEILSKLLHIEAEHLKKLNPYVKQQVKEIKERVKVIVKSAEKN